MGSSPGEDHFNQQCDADPRDPSITQVDMMEELMVEDYDEDQGTEERRREEFLHFNVGTEGVESFEKHTSGNFGNHIPDENKKLG